MMPLRSCGRTLQRSALWVAATLVFCGPAHASRKDTIVMKNGDHLTGEVKRLESGVLYVDLDYVSGSIGLDWDQVNQVQSTGVYQITMRDGKHMVGTFEKIPANETVASAVAIVTPANTSVSVPPYNVIQMETQKGSFWRQLKGALGFGISYTSGNSQTDLNSTANAQYDAAKWAAGGSFTSSFSGQSQGSQTNLLELTSFADRYLSRNNFLVGIADFLHSSQQDLQLRSTFGGGFGHYWIRTSKNSLRWVGGAVYTRETFQSQTAAPTDQNVEGLIGSQYDLYRFDRYTMSSQIYIFPGLTDFGRVRLTSKSSLNVKLVNNFTLTFSFWDNFDSRPPINAKKNELGVSTNIGWTF